MKDFETFLKIEQEKTISKETRKKISEANKNKILSEEQKEYLRKLRIGTKMLKKQNRKNLQILKLMM